jgi:hypothetical protein
MPQDPIMVYHRDTGTPAVMHSVDAAEAVRLGDYVYALDEGQEADPQAKAQAMARFKGADIPQAELKTPEQRAHDTAVANAIEEQRTGQPVVPVVPAMPPVHTRHARESTRMTEPPKAAEMPKAKE